MTTVDNVSNYIDREGHRLGRKIHACFWHHDPTANAKEAPVAWGNDWVVVGIVVRLAFLERSVCLPVLFRLWQPKRKQFARRQRDGLGRAVHLSPQNRHQDARSRTCPAPASFDLKRQEGRPSRSALAPVEMTSYGQPANATRNTNRFRGLPTGLGQPPGLDENANCRAGLPTFPQATTTTRGKSN